MNRPSRPAILPPFFAVVALLLGLTGTISAAFNHEATKAPLGNFLLWELEASAFAPLELADPSREIGEWIYDDALGVPVYVRQNPWTFFDPHGLTGHSAYMYLAYAPEGTPVPAAPRAMTAADWKQTGASVWAGLGRGLVGLYELANHLSPAPNDVWKANKEGAAAYKEDITKSAEKVFGEKVDPNQQAFAEVLAPVPPVVGGAKLLSKADDAFALGGKALAQSARGTRAEVEAAIARLADEGTFPMPGQRALDVDHVLSLADKMESGKWDEALNFAEKNRPGVMKNPDGTETIISGHHRHVAAEVARGRGAEFKLKREELSSTTDDYKGDWEKVEREAGSKSD